MPNIHRTKRHDMPEIGKKPKGNEHGPDHYVKLLRYIKDHRDKYLVGPSFRDIQAYFGYSSEASATWLVKNLTHWGLIERGQIPEDGESYKAGAIALTQKGKNYIKQYDRWLSEQRDASRGSYL